jgi:hypothetical protein
MNQKETTTARAGGSPPHANSEEQLPITGAGFNLQEVLEKVDPEAADDYRRYTRGRADPGPDPDEDDDSPPPPKEQAHG